MGLKEFGQEKGSFTDTDSSYWASAIDFLQRGVFGFCCCGRQDLSLEYILGALLLVEKRKELDGSDARYEPWKQEVEDYFGSEGAKYFMWYWLDSKELTEHGGSVPGWLTKRGEEAIEAIKAALLGEDGV